MQCVRLAIRAARGTQAWRERAHALQRGDGDGGRRTACEGGGAAHQLVFFGWPTERPPAASEASDAPVEVNRRDASVKVKRPDASVGVNRRDAWVKVKRPDASKCSKCSKCSKSKCVPARAARRGGENSTGDDHLYMRYFLPGIPEKSDFSGMPGRISYLSTAMCPTSYIASHLCVAPRAAAAAYPARAAAAGAAYPARAARRGGRPRVACGSARHIGGCGG
jgi:hypothetical protein